jgi:predicted nuclease of predicted toxin-antitoxin system
MQVAIAEQLTKRGIDVVTARDLNQLGAEDINHLERATEAGRILCTHDADYVDLASAGVQHAGIVLGQQDKHNIGIWVKFLAKIHSDYSADEMRNLVKYVRPL